MLGIYLINEKIHLESLSAAESIALQKQVLEEYMQTNRLEPVKLNPYQLAAYYTIPHALLHDLRTHESQLDCLLMYSNQSIEDFSRTYPAKWLILKSYFSQVLTIV